MSLRKIHYEILACFLGLFLLIQVITFLAVKQSYLLNNLDSIESELKTSTRVFSQLLESQFQELSSKTSILVDDFAFKQAFSTDAETRFTALLNLRERIQADRMMLIGIEASHEILADTATAPTHGLPFQHLSWIAAAEQNQGAVSRIIILDDTVYQAALVPLMAPTPVAWVFVGEALDETWAQSMKNLLSSEVVVVKTDEPTKTIAHSLNNLSEPNFSRGPISTQSVGEVSMGGESYGALRLENNESWPVELILARSIDAGLGAYYELKQKLIWLVTGGVALFVLGAILIARAVTDPIRRLVCGIQEIGQGNYAYRVKVNGAAELKQLAFSFNQMGQDLESNVETLVQLNDNLQQVSTHLTMEAIVDSALDVVFRLVNAKAVAIEWVDANGNTVFTPSGSNAGKALLNDRKTDFQKVRLHSEPIWDASDEKYLAIQPIRTTEKVLGTIGFVFDADTIKPDEIRGERTALNLFVQQLAISLENGLLYQLSMYDRLTGLLNHSAFERQLEEAVLRASRDQSAVSLIQLDIDQFTELNNHLGHEQGSRIIAEVAEVLKGQARPMDVIARRGGDEFEIILPFANVEQARELAEEIRVKIESSVFLKEDNRSALTVSIGGATYPQFGDSARFLLQSADQALNAAKARGGNHVLVGIDENDSLTGPSGPELPYVFSSVKMQQVIQSLQRIASSSISVFLQGETGVGKEILADTTHRLSRRRDKPLVRVNCSAVPENLIESELFGHEKGAFTGASQRRIGRFEEAHGGTLFLDEIVDMPLSTQVKLLRVLEEKKIVRLGSNKEIPADVRLVSASNKDVYEAIREGHFREDLFFRLNGMVILIPPLRERKEDIPQLMKAFLARLNEETDQSKVFSPDVFDLLHQYNWPGNIRELRNVLERAFHEAPRNTITKSHIHFHYEMDRVSGSQSPIAGTIDEEDDGESIGDLKTALDEFEKSLLLRVLKRNDWNIIRSSKILNISRSRIYRKLEKFKIDVPTKA